MEQKKQDKLSGWLFVLGGIVIALVLIGFWTDGFGFYGVESAPGTTTPPSNPS